MKTCVILLSALLIIPTSQIIQAGTTTLGKDSLRIETATAAGGKYKWIGTNQGVYMINTNKGKGRFLTTKNSRLPDNYVTTIICYPDGQTLIGTHKGILLWDNFSFYIVNSENSRLPENDIENLCFAEGGLLIKTKHCGILKAIGECIQVFSMKPIKVLIQDKNK
ncbi:MAG: hypothetical protein ABIQ02_15425 [Saprospiraceae bacterium]